MTSDSRGTIRFTPMERAVGGIISALLIALLGWIGHTGMQTRDAVIRLEVRELSRDKAIEDQDKEIEDHERRLRELERGE